MSFFSNIKDKFIIKLFLLLEKYRLKYEKEQKEKIAFKSRGEKFSIGKDCSIANPKYISIGENFSCLNRLRLDAIDEYKGQKFTPEIIIGNNVVLNNDVHIGCINRIEIGDNCLFASRIYISDHNHGDTSAEMKETSPFLRKLVSKGAVIIEDNVWIGEGVAILDGVTIGKNSIIATNAVVTKSVPPNSIVAGVPAKVIKTY